MAEAGEATRGYDDSFQFCAWYLRIQEEIRLELEAQLGMRTLH